jgi:hypothetical protein
MRNHSNGIALLAKIIILIMVRKGQQGKTYNTLRGDI